MTPRSKELQEALAQCLQRLEAGDDIESCLPARPQQAEQLRPLLEAAAALRALPIEPYSRQAFQQGRARLRATLAQMRRQPSVSPVGRWWAALRRPLALVAVAGLIAVLALLALTTDLLRPGTAPTQAQVQGFLSSVQEGSLLITTPDGQLRIGLSESTQVVGAQGQELRPEQIVPGGPVRVEVEEEEGGGLTALRVQVEEEEREEPHPVKVEFSGSVLAVSGQEITLSAPFGSAVVLITAQTEMKGQLLPGTNVLVEAIRQPDGTYLGREIKVLSSTGSGQEQPSGDHEGSREESGPSSADQQGQPLGDDKAKLEDEKPVEEVKDTTEHEERSASEQPGGSEQPSDDSQDSAQTDHDDGGKDSPQASSSQGGPTGQDEGDREHRPTDDHRDGGDDHRDGKDGGKDDKADRNDSGNEQD